MVGKKLPTVGDCFRQNPVAHGAVRWSLASRPAVGLPNAEGYLAERLDLGVDEDLALVRSAAAGDERAFHVVMDRHARRLFRIAMSLSRSREDAEDICQETFIGAYRGLATFDGRSTVKTWLTKILFRRAAKSWHKNRHLRRTIRLDAPVDDNGSGEDGWTSGKGVPHVGERTGASDQQMDLMQVVQTLTPEYRDVVLLREVDGMSYAEIAEILGVPQGTVESRLFRARGELRKKLHAYAPPASSAAGPQEKTRAAGKRP